MSLLFLKACFLFGTEFLKGSKLGAEEGRAEQTETLRAGWHRGSKHPGAGPCGCFASCPARGSLPWSCPWFGAVLPSCKLCSEGIFWV